MYIDGAKEAHIQETNEVISSDEQQIQQALLDSITNLENIVRDTSFSGSILAQIAATSTKNTGEYSIEAIKKVREQMFQAYEEVQKIRTLITGKELIYHLYVTGPGEGDIMGIEIGASSLQQFISYEGDLRMSESKIRQAIENQEHTLIETENIKKLYELIIKENSQYSRRAKTRQKSYFLRNTEGRWITKEGSRKWRRYNLGHITEAIDKVNSSLLEGASDSDLLDSFFGTIRQDNVSGFFGGDNPFINAQVKANHAQLMAYKTIGSAVDKLLQCKRIIQEGKSKEKAKEIIYSLYGLKESQIDSQIDKRVDIFLEKFVSSALGV